MLGNGNPNSGTKGSNFRYQYGVLKLLEEANQLLTERIDNAGAPGVVYTGYAQPGTSETIAAWRIKQTTIAAGITSVLWADGNLQYDNQWSNRAILTYL